MRLFGLNIWSICIIGILLFIAIMECKTLILLIRGYVPEEFQLYSKSKLAKAYMFLYSLSSLFVSVTVGPYYALKLSNIELEAFKLFSPMALVALIVFVFFRITKDLYDKHLRKKQNKKQSKN